MRPLSGIRLCMTVHTMWYMLVMGEPPRWTQKELCGTSQLQGSGVDTKDEEVEATPFHKYWPALFKIGLHKGVQNTCHGRVNNKTTPTTVQRPY